MAAVSSRSRFRPRGPSPASAPGGSEGGPGSTPRPGAGAGATASLVALAAQRAGIQLPPLRAERLAAYCALLLEWNERINLTGARTGVELASEHLPDAFAMLGLVPDGARLLDVGSGGGLPAIPFAILRPDCAVTLVEPRQRRVAFLRTAARILGLPVEIAPCRVEDLARTVPTSIPKQPGRGLAIPGVGFDAVSSRATFAPGEWLMRAPPLARPGGRVLVFTTPAEEARLPGLAAAASRIAYTLASGRVRVLLALDVPRGTASATTT